MPVPIQFFPTPVGPRNIKVPHRLLGDLSSSTRPAGIAFLIFLLTRLVLSPKPHANRYSRHHANHFPYASFVYRRIVYKRNFFSSHCAFVSFFQFLFTQTFVSRSAVLLLFKTLVLTTLFFSPLLYILYLFSRSSIYSGNV